MFMNYWPCLSRKELIKLCTHHSYAHLHNLEIIDIGICTNNKGVRNSIRTISVAGLLI